MDPQDTFFQFGIRTRSECHSAFGRGLHRPAAGSVAIRGRESCSASCVAHPHAAAAMVLLLTRWTACLRPDSPSEVRQIARQIARQRCFVIWRTREVLFLKQYQ